MRILDKNIGAVLLLAMVTLLLGACTKEQRVYEIQDLTILPVNSEKNKPKTASQYISILHVNLFQRAISPNRMLDALKAIESIGDKQVAYDILVSKYMNDGSVILPTKEEMLADPDQFIIDTYKRFFIRAPTEAERTWMRNYIDSKPTVTPELIYFAFATSNEHFHY